ncbi:MAG TPA: alpha-amylase family glycosyl hydrolase, partial [Rhodothermales bacterium]
MRSVLLVASAAALSACSSVPRAPDPNDYTGGNWDEQVLYHVFVRSFHDANGDAHGDLEGIRLKLDYLQDLGVTGILLTPLYPSPFYHNYFADDFEGIDAELGDMESYHALVADLHARDMRLIMDTEIQYVTGEHDWYRDSFG